MMRSAFLIFALLFQLGSATDDAYKTQCRCLPSNSCWPKVNEWKTLNTSLSGKLLTVKPVASVCHDPAYDTTACQEVKASFGSSLWRSNQPGALDQTNFETSAVTNETCYIDSPRPSPCGQGSVAVYAVAATTVEDIQKGVNFSRKNNLRLSIKNSGHDYLGRSTARGSLQIWTHNMKSIDFSDEFIPAGCDSKQKGEPAVTIGAGVQLRELYAAVGAQGKTVVAGFANTVGAAGGYVQGGGHSPLGPWKGMAADNALQFTVVTADGSHVTANKCQNSDLFWALRGGGGGTFGVVTSVTLRTFPDVPMLISSVNFTAPAEAFWKFITDFHALLPTIDDTNGAGYYWIFTAGPQPSFTMATFFLNQTNITTIDSLYAPLIQKHQSNNTSLQYYTAPVESTAYIINSLLTGTDSVGSQVVLGSRLISRKFLESETGPNQLTQVLRKLAPNQGTVFTGHIVAGGQVTKNGRGKNAIDSALNPAWRKAVTHLLFSRGWENTTPFAEQKEIMRNMTKTEMPLLKSLEPSMGAYINEGDLNEDGWQQVFWGKNYPKLLRLKRKWDPKDVFMCKPCIGSERWDAEGICMVE